METFEKIKTFLTEYGLLKVISALVILIVGLWVIKKITKTANKIMEKRNMDVSLRGFLSSLIGWEAQGEQGVVKEIEIFTTKINTIDNKEVIIPNGVLSNGNITNYSSEDKRRVDIVIGVSYDADIKQTKEVLTNTILSTPYTLKEDANQVIVGELAESSVNFITRTWVKSADYWDAFFHITENIKVELDKANIEIPYPHSVEIEKKWGEH